MDSLIYLDHASTSYPKPPEVHQAVQTCMAEAGVNPGRGGYRLAVRAAQWVDETRHGLAQYFGLPDPNKLIFTMSCTDALNIAIKGFLKPQDRVISSRIEHNAVVRPLMHLAEAPPERSIALEWLSPDANGLLDLAQLEIALQQVPTQLVVLSHASNVVGSLQPIAEIGALVRKYNSYLLVDAAQTAGVVPIDIQRQNIDMLAWPGHKGLYGYMGIGGLCVGPRIEHLDPWREGGTGTDSMSLLQPTSWPSCLEAGTHNLPGIASLRGSLRALANLSLPEVLAHQQTLRQQLVDGLQTLGIQPLGLGPREKYVGTLSFVFPGLDAALCSTILDASFGIACRAGLHCAPLAHQAMQTAPDGTVRLSVGRSTQPREIEQTLDALAQLQKQMGS